MPFQHEIWSLNLLICWNEFYRLTIFVFLVMRIWPSVPNNHLWYTQVTTCAHHFQQSIFNLHLYPPLFFFFLLIRTNDKLKMESSERLDRNRSIFKCHWTETPLYLIDICIFAVCVQSILSINYDGLCTSFWSGSYFQFSGIYK